MELSVFCATNLIIDRIIWNAYLSGLTVKQAVEHIQKGQEKKAPELESVVLTQYRNFEMMEAFLHHPKVLNTQLIFALSAVTKQTMIHSYYQLDNRVVRELLGKKINHRLRKELDAIAQKTRISILGCRRMFENLKRVAKYVEDAKGNIVAFIMNHFLLSRELATQYLCIIFICRYRIDPNKRKLQQVPCKDYEYIASIAIQYFSGHVSVMDDMSSSIPEDSRILKQIFFSRKGDVEKYHYNTVEYLTSIGNTVLAEKLTANIFKTILRNLLLIGQTISNEKEFQDLFFNLMEKIVEPFATMGWTCEQMTITLNAMIEAFSAFNISSSSASAKSRFRLSFLKLLTGISLSSARLYQSFATPSVFGF